MPQRPGSHQLEEQSRAAFRLAVPARWLVRDIQPDYGLDLLVELFDATQRSTGQFIGVQLKATDRRPSPRTDRLSVPLSDDHLVYYQQTALPVLVVGWSRPEGRFFAAWSETIQRTTRASEQRQLPTCENWEALLAERNAAATPVNGPVPSARPSPGSSTTNETVRVVGPFGVPVESMSSTAIWAEYVGKDGIDYEYRYADSFRTLTLENGSPSPRTLFADPSRGALLVEYNPTLRSTNVMADSALAEHETSVLLRPNASVDFRLVFGWLAFTVGERVVLSGFPFSLPTHEVDGYGTLGGAVVTFTDGAFPEMARAAVPQGRRGISRLILAEGRFSPGILDHREVEVVELGWRTTDRYVTIEPPRSTFMTWDEARLARLDRSEVEIVGPEGPSARRAPAGDER